MALIKCPKCEQEISEKASVCPKCGVTLKSSNKAKICAECGKSILANVQICPNCGCPVKSSKSKKILIISICIILAVVLLLVRLYKTGSEQSYLNNMRNACSEMNKGVSYARNVGGLMIDVWGNSIWNKKDSSTDKYTTGINDFNDALKNYYEDEEIQQKCDDIGKNRDKVFNYMKQLKNPPKKYEDEYKDLKEYYEAYCEIVNIALDPNGSYNSISEQYNEVKTKCITLYDKIGLELSE